MLGYVTVGVKDMEKAKAFYQPIFAELGSKILLDMGRICFFGQSMGQPMVAICIPYNEEAPDAGNGNMIALQPGSKEKVDALYALALEQGAQSEGEPGQRIPDQFYGGYVRDPDGNKIAFFHFG